MINCHISPFMQLYHPGKGMLYEKGFLLTTPPWKLHFFRCVWNRLVPLRQVCKVSYFFSFLLNLSSNIMFSRVVCSTSLCHVHKPNLLLIIPSVKLCHLTDNVHLLNASACQDFLTVFVMFSWWLAQFSEVCFFVLCEVSYCFGFVLTQALAKCSKKH